jgi:HEAT repeat protein
MPLFSPNIAAMKENRDLAGLLLALKNKDARARIQAAKALGELGIRAAVPAIAELLRAPDRTLAERTTAADALSLIKDEGAIDAPAQSAARSRERERGAINAAVDPTDRKYSINFYVNRIAADESVLRSSAALALGQIGDECAVHALFELLASEMSQMMDSVKSDIRKAVADALKRAGERLIPLACEELKHPSAEVRQWAADCLGDFRSAAAIDALIAAANDEQESFDVREAAMRSLGNVGDRRAIPYLEDLLQSGYRSIGRDAEAALKGIRQRHPAHQPEN